MTDLISAPKFTDAKLQALFDYRIGRIRLEMARQGISVCVLNNPISLRYAINFDEYQLFQSHIPACYLFVPLEGPLVMHGASSRHFPNVLEYRSPHFLSVFDGGIDLHKRTEQFTQSLIDFMQTNGLFEAGNKIGIERFTPLASQALAKAGFQVVDAECVVESAKLIKHPLEIICIRHAIAVAQHGMHKMQTSLRPGLTENQLWSILHQINIANGGDWIEGHMLASGPRTNPWLQEASHRVIETGDLVAFDTDMIGPMGYMADISRTWVCGGGSGNAEQRAAYQHAYEEIHHNMALIKPGVSFKELCDQAFSRHPRYRKKRYVCAFHGAGLSDEYPKIYYPEDWQDNGYDGTIKENMVFCVESYSGAEQGREGVKLEEMVLVTSTGYEKLSSYPFETDLLN